MSLTHGKQWFCVAPVLFFGFDIAFTLAGQPAGYWSGYYHLANEASPPGYWLLAWHPLAFIGAAVVWAIVLCLVIMLLPTTLSKILSLAFVIGHTWGSASWFDRVLGLGYWHQFALFALASIAVVTSWNRYAGHG